MENGANIQISVKSQTLKPALISQLPLPKALLVSAIKEYYILVKLNPFAYDPYKQLRLWEVSVCICSDA